MSTDRLLQAVLAKFPSASPEFALDLIVECQADLNKVFALLGAQQQSKQRQLTFDGFIGKSKSKHVNARFKKTDLYTPEQVLDAGIYCTMHLDVLDASVANQLALQLDADSCTWKQNNFYLFERQVTSKHTTALYTDNDDILSGKQKATYQGRAKEILFPFTKEMTLARDRVQDIVRLYTEEWSCNVVLANKYASKTDKIDYHSDQLTHIGRRPIIAALSLGCTREFRIQKRGHSRTDPIYCVHVPHNSLLIMHGGCQELFKHSIPPMRTVEPDALLGATRISLTFRMYQSEYESTKLPRCKCDRPMILRTTNPKNGRFTYIWQCSEHYNTNVGCGDVRAV